jgi:hypothetical protein
MVIDAIFSMKMRLICVLNVIPILLGCNSREQSLEGGNERAPDPSVQSELIKTWDEYTENQAAPLDSSSTKIVGDLSTRDKTELLEVAARLKGLGPKVLEIVAYGDSLFTAAARVTTPTHSVYLVKNEKASWSIIHVVKPIH